MLPQGYYRQQQKQSLEEVLPQNYTDLDQYCSERTSVPLGHRTNPYYRGVAPSAVGQTPAMSSSTASSAVTSHVQPVRQEVTQSASAEVEALAHAYGTAASVQGCGYYDNRPDIQVPIPSFSDHHQVQQMQPAQQYHYPQQRWFPLGYCANSVPQGFQQNFVGGTGNTWVADRLTSLSSQFPDSPPDSGSEPYSPPNSNKILPDRQNCVRGNALNENSLNGNAMAVHPRLHQQAMGPLSSHMQFSVPAHGGGLSPSDAQHQQPQNQQMQQQLSTLQPMFSLPMSSYNYGGEEPPKLNHPAPQAHTSQVHQPLAGFSSAGTHPSKKRKYSDSPPGTLGPGSMGLTGIFPVKPEPCPPDLHCGIPPDCSEDDEYSYDFAADSGMFADGTHQVIKWTAHQSNRWSTLMDESMAELSNINYRVDADKGFNFASPDEAFVCQKKNHFQVTVHITVPGLAKFVKPVEGNIVRVDAFYLHFYGVKMESQTQMIKIEQSQSDRSKKQFHPVKIELPVDQVTKVTVGRLHFGETTANNMRKKGKPNPDQRYFQLVVALQAHCGDSVHMIAAQASERIIVRASNPGQFESDVEASWSRGKTSESIYHAGRVGINTDNPDESLVVHGNIQVTGHVISPSDVRAKKNIVELDTKEQLKNISQLKVYQYSFNEAFAEFAGLTDEELNDTGVLAQDVNQVLPDAVRETGDVILPGGQRIDNFLVVNKERIFIENVGAVKELCKVTDKLENRITEIEVINRKLAKLSALRGSFKSICSSISLSACSLRSRTESKSSSQNTATVSSSSASKQSRHSRHGHHLHGNNPTANQQAATSVCSSRAIQIAVIVLVLIMALCLMSITTLYVIDRQVYPHPQLSHVFLSTSAAENLTLADITTKVPLVPGGRLIPGASPEPLLPPECVLHPQYCSVQCCSVPSPPPQYDPDHDFSPVTVVKSTLRPPKKADKSTKSPNDVNYQLSKKKERWQMSAIRDHLLDSAMGKGVLTQPVVMKRQPPAPVSSTGSSLMTTTGLLSSTIFAAKSDSLIDDKTAKYLFEVASPVLALEENIIDGLPTEPVVIDDSRRNEFFNDIRNGRLDDYNPSSTKDVNLHDRVVELYFKQLNSTISTVYCSNSNCRQQKGGNYTYAIPLSARFPQLYMTIKFRALINDESLGISLCSESEKTLCSPGDSDINRQLLGARKSSDLEWDLPVGYFMNSVYVFRVFALNQVESLSNVCQKSSASVGSSFAEYQLTFYHVCS